MSAATVLTLANGKGVDLIAPDIDVSDFFALAEHVAKEKRFNGATPGVEYSVAEHLCLGADAILETGDSAAAAYFLLHDLKEALWKDDTTPKKRALAEIAEQRFGILADHILESFDLAEDCLDVAIHKAAGLDWPPSGIVIAVVKHWDKVMFVTEWRDLMHLTPESHPAWFPYAEVVPLPKRIGRPWPWRVARDAWLRRAQILLPALGGERA